MADNRPNNRPLDPDDDLLVDDTEVDLEAADASQDDHLAEATDNSGEKLAEADDVPQGVDDVVDDDDDEDDDGE